MTAGDDGEVDEIGAGEQRYVLTLFLTAVLAWAISLPIPARRGARSRGVARTGRRAVPPQASQACDRGWPILALLQVR